MPYLMLELEGSPEVEKRYRDVLRQYGLGIQKSSEQLCRALQLVTAQDGRLIDGAVFSLARHVAEEVDAISVLLEKGCVDPCKAHLRSAFEADLGLRYILNTDSERRALAYDVKEARERLRSNELFDERTPMGKRVREATKNEEIGPDILASLPPCDFDAVKASLTSMLTRPPYDAINAQWEAQGKRTTWHGLFGGPSTIRDLAYHLRKGFWYEFLYSDWSGRIHAGRALRNVGVKTAEPEGPRRAIRPIRHPEGISAVYNFAMGMAVALAYALGDRYLTEIGRDDLRKWFVDEIRPINQAVQRVNITADWH